MYNLFKYLKEVEGRLISISNLVNLYDNQKLDINLADEIKSLIYNGVDPSTDDNFSIRYASRNGYIEIVKLLLQDDRVDPSVGYNEAIGMASMNGHLEIVKLLLQDSRVDPSDHFNFTILIAYEKGHREFIKLLLQDDRVKDSLTREEYLNLKSNI